MKPNIVLVLIVVGLAVVVVALLAVIKINAKRRKISGDFSGGETDLVNSLYDEKRKSEIILSAIQDGVMLIDHDALIQLFNPGAAAITGWSVEDTVALNYHSVLKVVDQKGQPVPESANPFSRIFSEAKAVRNADVLILTKANKQVRLSLSLSPLFDDNKQVTAAVAVFRDVTEEKQQEQQRADFISTASHEMRTPVAAIEGYLALAINDKVSTIDNRARNYLEKAHSSTQHLGQLFQDLLTSAKAEDGRLSAYPKVVELGSFLEQLSGDLRFSAEKKGLFVEYLVGNNTKIVDATKGSEDKKVIKPFYYITADPDRLREVVTNLFDNAVKYTDEGKVTLGLTGDDQVVQMYVKDTGPGIPAEDIPHLFQKFYRVDNSATRTIGGTGLGLFISRKIVELFQGRIWVESEQGKGSTFFINFPRLTTEKATQMLAQEQNPMDIPATV